MARAAAAAGFLWPYLLWRHPQARWREQLRLPSNAIVAAAAGGHLEVLTFLLGQGGADAKEEDGTTPLMAAAEAGSVECVGKLLEGLTLTLTLTLTPTLTLPLPLPLPLPLARQAARGPRPREARRQGCRGAHCAAACRGLAPRRRLRPEAGGHQPGRPGGRGQRGQRRARARGPCGQHGGDRDAVGPQARQERSRHQGEHTHVLRM